MLVRWQFHTLIAMTLVGKFPKPADVMRRIGASLLFFVPLTALVNTLVFVFYQQTGVGEAYFDTKNYFWALISGIGLNMLVVYALTAGAHPDDWEM